MAEPSPDSTSPTKDADKGPVFLPEDVKVIEEGGLEKATSADSRRLSACYILDPAAERRLVWKFDLRILPVLAVMYLFNSLDKSNLGNAKTAGLEKTLHLTGDQYNIILSVFFVPYVLTAPFLGILGKKYGPSRILPIMMFCFGFVTVMVVAVKNFGGLMTIRWFLGMCESAFFPLVIYYQTTFYRRGELARRLALFYAAQSIASAFGGLLAFGVFQIKSGHLADWRYLFLIEGLCTLLFSLFAFWYLPYNAAQAKFLTEDEKKLAFYRMQVDSSSVVNEAFNLRDALKIFKHPTSWIILGKLNMDSPFSTSSIRSRLMPSLTPSSEPGIEICLGVPLQSVQLFLPVIIKRLGYSTVKVSRTPIRPPP